MTSLADYLAAVQDVPGYSYVASPYSRYPSGIETAFVEVCRVTAALLRMGIPVFSPIAHSHPIAIHGNIDPFDHSIWLPADEPLMDAAHGLIVVQMTGWDDSYGVNLEINRFKAAGKPVVYLDPRTLRGEPCSRERQHYLHSTWKKIIGRCTCNTDADYPGYGGRGITVCDRWRYGESGKHGFECFLEDMGDRPEGTTIDRIDNDKGYWPQNCRWATSSQQQTNKRTKTHCKRGHPLTPENVRNYNGARLCIHCRRRRTGPQRPDGTYDAGTALEQGGGE